MKSTTTLLLLLPLTLAQHAPTPNGCTAGFSPGRDEVLYTVPYPYTDVLSIIGSYQNLTWSGNPPSTVQLSGPDNTVNTTRTYDIAGAHVIETITTYSKPAQGPYEEIHTLGPLTIPSANVSFSADYDGTTVTPVCGGGASAFNFTVVFCASDASLAASVLHGIHLQDAVTVGVFLGGRNFSSCAALGNGTGSGSGSGSGSGGNSSAVPFAGEAGLRGASLGAVVWLGGAAALAAAVGW